MFLQHVRSFIRQVRRTPGPIAIVALTLALGAGADAVMFSITYSVLLRPLPYADSDRLVQLQSRTSAGEMASVSLPNFRDWKSQSTSFNDMAAYTTQSSSLQGPSGIPIRVDVVASSANLISVLGVQPMLGRGFLLDEDQPGKQCAMLLSASVWNATFSSDPGIAGRAVRLDGQPCTIVGVMPKSFAFPDRADNTIWTALRPSPNMDSRGTDFLNVIGRLNSNVTLEQARSELTIVASRLAAAYPDEDKGLGIQVTPYRDVVTGNVKMALWALVGVVVLVQLIICANVANMQMTLAIGRQREMAIRTALGAGAIALVWQLLVESSLLALLGAGIGLAGAAQAIQLLKRVAVDVIPRVEEIQLYPVVYVALFVTSTLTAVLFGLAPMVQVLRQNVETSLRENAKAVRGGRGQQRSRDILVAGQLALAVVLLTGSVVMLRSLYLMLNQDLGLDARNVLTLHTSTLADNYNGRDLMATLYGPQLDRIRHLPGVASAGLVTFLPLSAGHATANFILVGKPPADPQHPPQAALNAASEDYFEALRIPLVQGRVFSAQDSLAAPRVAVVNDALAKRYFPNENPIGRQLAFNDPEFQARPLTIIGVVQGNRQQKLTEKPEPEIYFDLRQVPPNTVWAQFLQRNIMTYLVRTNTRPELLSSAVQGVIREVDHDQTLFDIRSMEGVVTLFVRDRRLALTLLAAFAGLALIVATSGLYAMLSYIVKQRSADIAIRMALGAAPGEIVRMIAVRALQLNFIGLGLGICGAIVSGQLVSTMLYGVQTWDPVTLAATCTVLLFVTLPATWLPAYRASRVNPLEALRSE